MCTVCLSWGHGCDCPLCNRNLKHEFKGVMQLFTTLTGVIRDRVRKLHRALTLAVELRHKFRAVFDPRKKFQPGHYVLGDGHYDSGRN